MATRVKSEDLQDVQTALINLSKVLTDIDGNIALAIQRAHNEWKDDMFDGFKEMYDKYKQRVVEIADEYNKFATVPLQVKIDQLKDAEDKAKKMNQ